MLHRTGNCITKWQSNKNIKNIERGNNIGESWRKMFPTIEKPKNLYKNTSEILDEGTFTIFKINPAQKQSSDIIIYYHGGGFVFGPISRQWRSVSKIAQLTGNEVWVVNYRMGPENQYPDGHNDAIQAYKTALKTHAASDILLMGDSAGGTMVLSIVNAFKSMGLPMPQATVLISPAGELRDEFFMQRGIVADSIIAHAVKTDKILREDKVSMGFKNYFKTGYNVPDAKINPILADYQNFPKSILFISTGELLYPQFLSLKSKMEAAKVDLTVVTAKDRIHIFPIADMMLSETQLGVRMISDYIIDNR